jgi:topoisomerase IA-like protein
MKEPDDPYEVTLERAIELIEARQERDKARTLKDFVYDDKP